MPRRTLSPGSPASLCLTAVGLALILFTLLALPAAAEDAKRGWTPEELAVTPAPGPNPWLSFLPADAEVDWDYWHAKMRFDAEKRAATRRVPTRTVAVTDTESNNSVATAQAIAGFGTDTGLDPAAKVNGSIAAPVTPSAFMPAAEDNGSIPLASATGLTSGNAVTATGTIGDGPHGSGGSGSADFDFFAITGVVTGQRIAVSVTTADPSDDLDPNTAVWNSAGELVAFNEDIGFPNFDSSLVYTAEADGTYYVSVGGWKSSLDGSVLPQDPFDSSSGTGAASEGDYTIVIGLDSLDVDCFAVDLRAGDILGASTTTRVVEVYEPGGELRMASNQDGSGLYSAASPLPGGTGVAADMVAAVDGAHFVCIQGGNAGAYTLTIEAYRTTLELEGAVQTLFVDFDGATIDPAIFGDPPGTATLSPLSSFLSGWGLGPGDEDAVIDAILASVEETVQTDLAAGPNPSFRVEILNSRDHADPFGQPNVSRLIVGGTIAELGIGTIGIAETIDPGNFGTTDTAVVLLDLLSAPASDPNSLNQFPLGGGATIIDLVGVGVGNITAHEAGHFLGNWHTENDTAISGPSIMDQGGNLANSIGVGPDGIFGTGDDVDVDLGPDAFESAEGFVGIEPTGERTAFGLTTGPLFADGFESGNVTAWSQSIP